MDVLSEVLRVVRLAGAIHFCAEFTRPWAIVTSPPEMLPARLAPDAESITQFHIAMSGRCWLSCGKLQPISFEAGDVVVFARGDRHIMTSDPGLAPVPIKEIYRPSPEQISILKHGGGGEESRFICGYLRSDQRFDPLLNALPALLHIRVRNGAVVLTATADDMQSTRAIAVEHEAGWWQAAVGHLIGESTRPGPGTRAVLARLSELLFLEVVRWQLRQASQGRGGWLSGLNDPHVGRALALLHAEPARQWTVEQLAEQLAMSRAALAKRFVELVGEAPMQYLAAWRMHLAKHLLIESTLNLAVIASRVGYESEAAFNRAFSRVVGTPPGTWRQAKAGRAGASDDRLHVQSVCALPKLAGTRAG